MSRAPTHYEVLGVPSSASAEQIRSAYRARARRAHPDATGATGASGEIVAINEAWRVLSDPARRAVYDASLRGDGPGAGSAAPSGNGARSRVPAVPVDSARPSDGRFPKWPFVLLFVLAVIFIITAGALRRSPSPPRVDNLLGPGSCVRIESNGDAAEVDCTGPHDAIVVALVETPDGCTVDTESHRDRQGRGTACVRRVS